MNASRPAVAVLAAVVTLTLAWAAPAFAQVASPSAAPASPVPPAWERAARIAGPVRGCLCRARGLRWRRSPRKRSRCRRTSAWRSSTGVWEGIRDVYVDPETNGPRLGGHRRRVRAARHLARTTRYEVYELLREMVGPARRPLHRLLRAGGPRATRRPRTPATWASARSSTAARPGTTARACASSTSSTAAPAQEAGIGRATASSPWTATPARVSRTSGDRRAPASTSPSSRRASAPARVTLERRRIDPDHPARRPAAWQAHPAVGYLRVIALSGARGHRRHRAGPHALRARGAARGAHPRPARLEPGRAGRHPESLRPFVSGEVGAFHSRTGTEPIDDRAQRPGRRLRRHPRGRPRGRGDRG